MHIRMQNEQYRSKLQKSNESSLALVKAGMDIVVAVGLLQLAPKKVTPRVTGAFGFVTSLVSCYQVCSHNLASILYTFVRFVFRAFFCLLCPFRNVKLNLLPIFIIRYFNPTCCGILKSCIKIEGNV